MVNFSIAPPFWQTWWFRTLGIITIALLPLLACTPDAVVQLDDARYATGSRTMVSSPDADRLYALNVERAPVDGSFTGPQVRQAIYPHVLAEATYSGTYTLNRRLAT